jgi:hypothetical protein
VPSSIQASTFPVDFQRGRSLSALHLVWKMEREQVCGL